MINYLIECWNFTFDTNNVSVLLVVANRTVLLACFSDQSFEDFQSTRVVSENERFRSTRAYNRIYFLYDANVNGYAVYRIFSPL